MITSLTNINKRTNNALAVTYSQKVVNDDDGDYFEVTRHATHSYEFLGLDRDAAVTLAKLKRAKYARFDTEWMRRTMDVGTFEDVMMWTRTDSSGRWYWRVKNGANVTLSPEGNRWKVTVDVDEEDVAYSNPLYAHGYDFLISRVNDPEKIFNDNPQFSMRTYDDGDDAGSPVELTGNYYMTTEGDTGARIRLYLAGPFVVDSAFVPAAADMTLQTATHVAGGSMSSWSDCSGTTIDLTNGYIELSTTVPIGATMSWFRMKSTYDSATVYSNPIAVSGYWNAD